MKNILIPIDLPKDILINIFLTLLLVSFLIILFAIYYLTREYKKNAFNLKITKPFDLLVDDFEPLRVLKHLNWIISICIISLFLILSIIVNSYLVYIALWVFLFFLISYSLIRIVFVLIINKNEKLTPPIFKYRKVTNWWGKPKY